LKQRNEEEFGNVTRRKNTLMATIHFFDEIGETRAPADEERVQRE